VQAILKLTAVVEASSYKNHVTDHISKGKSASFILKKHISLYYNKDQER